MPEMKISFLTSEGLFQNVKVLRNAVDVEVDFHKCKTFSCCCLRNVAATDNNRPVQGGGNIVWSRESCQTGRCPGVSRGCLVDKPM